ncbi:MAG: hypothetical protein AUK35_10870 [Zetaproteobacteria bacterium CG2_30_46_52]|nr:MAG: hypothetical protein AUK35_10870 [Zetaproteobacteria bacterium CG2_30_46_52]
MQTKKRKSSWFQSIWLVLLAPLVVFPWMLNLRVFPFIAPNEEPKWALLILCGLWLGLTAAWLRLKRQSISWPRPNLLGWLFASYFILLGLSVWLGPNTTEGLIRYAFWLIVAAIWLVAAWAARTTPKWTDALIWSTSITGIIFSIRYWQSYFIDYGTPNYNIHVLFSPIGHVNFTGDVLVILLPMLVWILATTQHAALRVVNWFSVVTISTILLVASSRGALGGLALAGLLVVFILIKHRLHWQNTWKKEQHWLPAILIGSALLISLPIYNALPFHYRDLARVSASAGQAVTGEGKLELTEGALQPPLVEMWVALSPLLGARTPIYASTTAMTLDAPWLGQGTGNFAWVYPYYSNRFPDFKDSLSSARTFTTNPHNIVLQIASQNGIPAMLIFMGLLLTFWYRLLKASWQQWDPWFTSGLAAVTAAIFDAMFNHVFFNPASMFTFALLAGTWWGTLPASTGDESKPSLVISNRVAAIVLIVFTLALSIWPIRWLVSEWYTGQAMAHARYASYEADFYNKAYRWDKENFRAVFGMGQVAYKQKSYAESAGYFEEFESFYPYNPPALNMLGAAYMMSGQFEKAEAALQRTLDIYPGFEMAEQNLQRVQAILQQQKLQQPR